MTITVSKLKRAVEECAEAPGFVTFQRLAFEQLCQDPAMLTMLAEKLSERPPFKPNGVPELIRAMKGPWP